MDDATFTKIAGANATRLTFDEARELLDRDPRERPRIYLYWDEQIVRVHSVEKLIGYWPSSAIWTKFHT